MLLLADVISCFVTRRPEAEMTYVPRTNKRLALEYCILLELTNVYLLSWFSSYHRRPLRGGPSAHSRAAGYYGVSCHVKTAILS
jgi:hypothetical protein